MALEAVDRRNPVLVRVGTVKDVLPHSFLLHFDGWSEIYDYWVDDDCPDNHPAGWCAKTGHPLQPPPSEFDLGESKNILRTSYIFRCKELYL